LGAFQTNTLESMINSLQVALENTTAAESAIRDADFAAETSNLTRAQILQQAASSALLLANQAPQSVLSLLR
jgi:flagellin